MNGAGDPQLLAPSCSSASALFDPACANNSLSQDLPANGSTPRSDQPFRFDFPNDDRSEFPSQQQSFSGMPGSGSRPMPTPVPQPQLPQEPPTEFQRFVNSTVGHALSIYGSQLFLSAPSTFAPLDQVPVSSDYVLGPGDELLLRSWGSINFSLRRTIDRNGSIYIPNVGQMQVAGLRYSELKPFLQAQVGHIFQRFELSVEMGRLRSIQVYVVGKARRPGSYTVSSLSSVVNVLFSAGGPSVAGSMRHIQLKRNSQLITDVDLYDLLLKGDKSADARIQQGDIIYIPPAGPRIALAGSVNEPAIYELREGETLGQILDLEGGVSTMAGGQSVQLERVEQRQSLHVADISLDSQGLKTPLQDGDILFVRSLVPRHNDAVTLRGNVANPGRYAWKTGMRVRDLIPDKDMLLTRRYWEQRNKSALAIRNIDDGEKPQDTTKESPDSGSVSARQQRISNIAESSGYTSPKPDEKDPEQKKQQDPSAPLAKLTPPIDWDYAVIERLNREDYSTVLIPFHLGKMLLQHDDVENLELQPGDIITIFSQADVLVPQRHQRKLVRLEGEFQAAGVYSVHPGETLRQLVARAGGLTPEAYLYGSSFTRESTRLQQQARLEDYATRLEADIQRAGANKAGSVVTPAEAAVTAATLESQKALIEKLHQLRATGRIVLGMQPVSRDLTDIPDIPLEDGDAFVVPSAPSNISVIGSVYDQNSFLYRSVSRVSDYLDQAGGVMKNADDARIFVIRADGSVISRSSKTAHHGNLIEAKLNPGDAIVVPEKINKTTLLRGLTDWSAVFSQFTLGAAAVNILR